MHPHTFTLHVASPTPDRPQRRLPLYPCTYNPSCAYGYRSFLLLMVYLFSVRLISWLMNEGGQVQVKVFATGWQLIQSFLLSLFYLHNTSIRSVCLYAQFLAYPPNLLLFSYLSGILSLVSCLSRLVYLSCRPLMLSGQRPFAHSPYHSALARNQITRAPAHTGVHRKDALFRLAAAQPTSRTT